MNGSEREENKLTEFGEELSYFLRAQGLDETLVKSLRNYDFSETKRMGFVHTMCDQTLHGMVSGVNAFAAPDHILTTLGNGQVRADPCIHTQHHSQVRQAIAVSAEPSLP